jgi:hypothetical protein
LPVSTTIRTVLAGRTRAETQRRALRFRLPTVVVQRPAVSLISTVIAAALTAARRAPRTMQPVEPPAITAPLDLLNQATISTTLAAIPNATERVRHAPRSALKPPTVIIPLPAQDVTDVRLFFWVSVNDRLTATQRAPHTRLSPPAVVRPYLIVTWRLNPDNNWVFEAAEGNFWRLDPEQGWLLEPATDDGWRIDPDPIDGWTMEASTP